VNRGQLSGAEESHELGGVAAIRLDPRAGPPGRQGRGDDLYRHLTGLGVTC
jgi:hypothetical protein